MAFPDVVTREQWLVARKRLLDLEKQATRARDALNAERRRLPMVQVEKEYVLEGPDGTKTLAGLFGDSGQLIVRHVMFGPDWAAACPGCTAGINEMSDGLMTHLRSRDTAFVLVSRAPLAKLEKYRAEQGWTYPWYSSFDSDFNVDFQATLDRGRGQLVHNYREEPAMVADTESTEVPRVQLLPARGRQGVPHVLDLGPGQRRPHRHLLAAGPDGARRQEDWEEPKDRAPRLHGADPTFRG